MSLRRKLVSLLDVLLRVPPLFIIDELFRNNLGLNQEYVVFRVGELFGNDTHAPNIDALKLLATVMSEDDQNHKVIIYVLKIVLSCFGCLASLCVFLLWTKHLIFIYLYLFSLGVVVVSYWCNTSAMAAVIAAGSTTSLLEDILSVDIVGIINKGTSSTLIQNVVIQFGLSAVFFFIRLRPRSYPLLESLCPLAFLFPTFLALLPLPNSVLYHAPVFAAVVPLAMVKFVLWCSIIPILQTIYAGYIDAKNFVSNLGLVALVESEWERLSVPTVLRVFWIVRLLEHFLALPAFTDLLFVVKSLMISGCETLTAVMGMTSVISCLCHYTGSFFEWVLMSDDEDDRSIGTMSALLFYILALQTGLTGLEPEKRFVRLCRNFFLLYTALLHFIHSIVNPLLMSLSASHNPSLHRHLRALLVCLFLIVYPMSLLAYLWRNHPMSTWLLAVSVFSIEVIIKVIVSLLIYSLFLIDAYRTTFWEKLDDYVYYIRAFGNTVEFCFGIFLFFNGAFILLFESGGTIRAAMMGIHAYFNIWCEARAGWCVFMRRRTAVNKIESLPTASPDQLASLDDVCAICYQEMKTAKITTCNHYFHGVCLRKWLYIQDRCPMCHDILYKVDGNSEGVLNRHFIQHHVPR